MNKYGVTLVGGTIGSVFAGGNCSVKVDKGSKSSKDGCKTELEFFCEAFGIRKEDIVYEKEIIDDSQTLEEEEKKKKENELIKFRNNFDNEARKLGAKYVITYKKIVDSNINEHHYAIISDININKQLLDALKVYFGIFEVDDLRIGCYSVEEIPNNFYYYKKKK